ncbi:hypothetical protein GF324_10205 [bacterium]|nr:hypothetical protein [bacterium]
MASRNLFDPFIRYHLWAHDRIHTTLSTTRPLVQPAADLYAHLVHAEQLWMQRVGWMDHQPENLFPEQSDFAETERIWHGVRPVWERIVIELGHMDLSELIEYTSIEGETFRHTISDILLQLLNHGTHHRSQINALLRRGGMDPPEIDYIAWVRQQ